MQQRGADPAISQTEAFELLGNETRLAVIQELARHRRTNWRWDGLTFAELRKAVGVDDAGTFNYHLDQLRGYFVVKAGDEYVLNQRGLDVADAVLAGMYGEQSVERRAATDLSCPACRESLDAVYEDGLISLRCERHGRMVATSLPPGAVADRSMGTVVDAAFRDMRQDVEMAREGFCLHCWGRMHGQLAQSSPLEHPGTGNDLSADPGDHDRFPLAVFGCERCETVFWTQPSGTLLGHPAVVSFYHDHGVDVTGVPFVDDRVADAFAGHEMQGDGVAVSFARDGDRLTLTLDEHLEVVAVEREADGDNE